MIRIFRHYIPRWSLLLLGLEAVAFAGAVYAGVAMRFFGGWVPEEYHAPAVLPRALLFMVVMVVSMTATGRYQRLMTDGLIGELLNVTLSFVIGLLAMSLIFYMLPDLFIGRGAFIYALGFALAAVLGVRWLFFRFLLDHAMLKRRVLVFGAGRLASLVTPQCNHVSSVHRPGDYVVVGYWPVTGGEVRVAPERLVQEEVSLAQFVRSQGVDEIILAVDDPAYPLPITELLDCKVSGIRILEIAGFIEQQERRINMAALRPDWWLFNSEGVYHGTLRDMEKRAFDLLLSLAMLLLCWPLMLLAVIAIRLDSPGPVFYRQQRVGFGGRVFLLTKFRSMRADAEGDGIARWSGRDDDRITRVGRVIRYTRIDELPQLFNVLKGEMSLVGPRPERPEFVSVLQERIPYFAERLRVKPGITGWAQICYGYGASEQDAVEKLKYDLYYVKNHTLFFDLLVLIQSVEVVMFGRGARGPLVTP